MSSTLPLTVWIAAVLCLGQASEGKIAESDLERFGTYWIAAEKQSLPAYGDIEAYCSAELERDRNSSDRAKLLVWRAHARIKLGTIETAATDAQRAIDLQPDYGMARIAKVRALNRLGREAEALLELDHVPKQDRCFLDGEIVRAITLVSLNEYERALVVADQIGERHDMSFLLRALVFARTNRDAETLEACDGYLARHSIGPAELPDLPFTLRADALAKLARYDECIVALRTALTVKSDSIASLKAIVRLLTDRGRYTEAESRLKRLQQIEPDSEDSLMLSAVLEMKQLRYSSAIPILRKLRTIAPKNEKATVLLAESMLNCGEHKLAVAELDRFRKQAGDARNILFARSIVVGLDPTSDSEALQSAASHIKAVAAETALAGNVALMAGYICARAGDRTYAIRVLDRIGNFELDNEEREFKRGLRRAIESNDDLKAYLREVSDLGKSIH